LVTYCRKKNGGQASALNYGLACARGELIFLLDGDDYYLPGKITAVVGEFAKQPEVGMVYHPLREIRSDGCSSSPLTPDGFQPLSGFIPDRVVDLLSYQMYPTSGLIFRKSVIEKLLPIPEALTIQPDAYLAGLIIFVAPVAAIPDALAAFRLH